jgi:putative DNA primase/helicase
LRSVHAPLHVVKARNKAQVSTYVHYPLTDCGNAERLVDQHGDSIRFCRAMRQWFVWNGSRWTADGGGAVQLAKKTVRAIHHERNLIERQAERDPLDWEVSRERADALAKWATRSESSAQIAGMLRLAESDPRIAIEPEDFDNNPWLLNLANGTIELDSGRIRENRAEELLTKIAGAEHQANAACPRWESFLTQVFQPHPEIIPFIERAVGYSLTGDTREECVFVLAGTGRNGKSTFLRVLHQLLRDYGGVAEIETFLSLRGSTLREDIADMRGRRFVSAQEPLMTGAFAEATLKWVSGGDRLRARRLYEHAMEFQPTHKLWLAVNRLPRLRSDDLAAWSRLRIIPFDVSFQHRANRDLKFELQSELSGILRWALRGCLLWQQEGLGSAAPIEKAAQLSRMEVSHDIA